MEEASGESTRRQNGPERKLGMWESLFVRPHGLAYLVHDATHTGRRFSLSRLPRVCFHGYLQTRPPLSDTDASHFGYVVMAARVS